MSTMASQITSVLIVCAIVCSGEDQRKHQSSASLAFVRGIHRWPINSPHKGPVTRKMFPFDDVIMCSLFLITQLAAFPHPQVRYDNRHFNNNNIISIILTRKWSTILYFKILCNRQITTSETSSWCRRPTYALDEVTRSRLMTPSHFADVEKPPTIT